jgi:hypothetical protein
MTNNTYALGFNQITNLIATIGTDIAVMAQGDMGTGKSSMLTELAERFPNHVPCYFDCTTKSDGDVMLPKLKDIDGNDFVRYATNEELGLHLTGRPIIIMVDEYGKAIKPVQNALLRLMQERQVGPYKLHPDSLVFCTTNLAAEGVGDILPPHARNRIMVVRARKPDATEWIEWGINNKIEPLVLSFVREFPQVLQSFEDVRNPDDNPYIFHPQAQRPAFVTPRSLHKASTLLQRRHLLDDATVTAGLIGLVGAPAAMDMMAYIHLADDLPKLGEIKSNPETAPVPTSVAAVCMIVYRTLSSIEGDWIDAWMRYLNRLQPEAQAMFANGVRSPGYKQQGMVMTNARFTTWARQNSHCFAADKV